MNTKITKPTDDEFRDWIVQGVAHGPYHNYLASTCASSCYWVGRRVYPSSDLPTLNIDAAVTLLAWACCGDTWLIHLKWPDGGESCYFCTDWYFRVLINLFVHANINA